jgi:acyl-coenzyme A synthetase/AMP-(fatty) acid ligase
MKYVYMIIYNQGGDLLDEKVWRWLFEVVCRKNVLIFDGYGESEIGSPLAAGLVFANEIGGGLEGGFMPISCIQFVLLDEEVYYYVFLAFSLSFRTELRVFFSGVNKGNELPCVNSSGQVCIPNIHPGIVKTIKNNHEKYLDTYFRPFPGEHFF